MRKNILLTIIFFSLNACNNSNSDALGYYKNLTEINNEIFYQVHLTLQETKKLILSNTYSNDSQLKADYVKLKMSYDSISCICKRSISKLTEIGPLGSDSSLYNSFLQSLDLINTINHEEFASFLSCVEQGEMNLERINVLYSASVKLAESHVSRVDSILLFNKRHQLNLDTLELLLSRKKAEKFNSNISIIHNSIPIMGNCKDGYGQLKGIDGSLYTGHFKNGLFDGKGLLQYSNGDSYEGNFKEGSFQGFGTYYYNNGTKYEGEWREDIYNGIGKMIWASGDSTFGYWLNGKLTDI